jgi:hypothetical protein
MITKMYRTRKLAVTATQKSRDISRIKRRSSAGIGGRPGFDFYAKEVATRLDASESRSSVEPQRAHRASHAGIVDVNSQYLPRVDSVAVRL